MNVGQYGIDEDMQQAFLTGLDYESKKGYGKRHNMSQANPGNIFILNHSVTETFEKKT